MSTREVRCGIMLMVLLVMPRLVIAQIDTLAVIGNTGAAGSHSRLVQIVLLNAEKIAGLQLTLTDTPNALVIDSVKTTPRSAGLTPNWNDNTQKILLVDFSGQHTIDIGSGPVLQVFYSVRSNAIPGIVNLTLMNVILADASAHSIPVAPVSGTFRVTKGPAGIKGPIH